MKVFEQNKRQSVCYDIENSWWGKQKRKYFQNKLIHILFSIEKKKLFNHSKPILMSHHLQRSTIALVMTDIIRIFSELRTIFNFFSVPSILRNLNPTKVIIIFNGKSTSLTIRWWRWISATASRFCWRIKTVIRWVISQRSDLKPPLGEDSLCERELIMVGKRTVI